MFSVDELNDIGAHFISQGEFEKAIDALTDALELDANNPTVLSNLGNAYASIDEPEKAKEYFELAIELETNQFQANHSLGFIYYREGNFEKALKYFNKALKTDENFDLLFNLSIVYEEMGMEDERIKFLEKAAELDGEDPIPYYNVAVGYANQENYDKAIEVMEKSIAKFPDHKKSLAMLYLWYRRQCEWEKAEKINKKLTKIDPLDEEPQANIIRAMDPKENQRIAKAWAEDLKLKVNNEKLRVTTQNRKTSKRIRVGYVSDGFCDFPTGHKIVGLFENHDLNKFEVFTYMTGEDDDSNFYGIIQNLSPNYRQVDSLNVSELEEIIVKDKIDILVDLKGWTRGNSLEVFAARPANINISWLGFPGTTGADFIDYAIVDRTVVPKSHEKYWTEKLLFMPYTYQITDAPLDDSGAERKVTKKMFIYGAFNLAYKITEEIYISWMRILKKNKNSVLWILDGEDRANSNLIAFAKKQGVNKNRIVINPRLPKKKHLERLRLVDLALDTFPVNGHTTTIDCLSVGVPVVTIMGNHFASRVSASVLRAAGLPKLITKDLKEYERLAVSLAKSKKKTINKQSALFNTAQFVKDLEKLYEEVCKKHRIIS